MTEFPGYLPWQVAGDPWFTYDEIDALLDALGRRNDQRRAAAQKTNSSRPSKRAWWGRRR